MAYDTNNKSRSSRIMRREKASDTHLDIDNGTIEGKTKVKPLAKVVQRKKKLNSPILVAGFPGAGLVGSISTSYIINKLHMNQIACVESEFIVPGVIYAEGKLRHPFRLYSNDEGNVCVLVCEAPIMAHGMYSVLDTVVKWALNNKVKEVLVLDGIAVEGLPDSKRMPIILSSDGRAADAANLIHDDNNNINNSDVTNKEEDNDDGGSSNIYPTTAFIGGIAGGILSSCLSNGIASKALLIYAARGIPDPEGAAILIESLSKITNNESLKIDTQQLRKQGASLKMRMEKIIQSFAEQQQEQGQQGQSPARSREGVMYG
ncbi:MAG TPA: PAC2 family protein [Nitrososphaeraceae archaeon]|nr:PAC2 family protein [Nitrososphaeraceae archaeon]